MMKSYINFEHNGEEYEIDVEIEYSAFRDPGKTSGPPEDCYPPDNEMEILSVKPVNLLPPGITLDQFNEIVESNIDAIEEKAWEHFDSTGDDYYENDD